jgi:hypothetical protein
MPSRIKALEKTIAARIRQGTRRGYALRVKYSLRHPPSGLTLTHQLLWPLIFAQLVALKLWVRRQLWRRGALLVLRQPLGQGQPAPHAG